MKLTYPAIFYKDEKNDAYAVEIPDLPGCATGGDTLADAIFMAIDAASGWVLDELEDGNPAPVASLPEDLNIEAGSFVSMIALDIAAYAEKYGNKAVRKNLTIPAWLNTFAESEHINFSQVLQDSLTDMYYKQKA
ncbi:MAG: type II toxin-antitoxin system HicB family antitoxin [Deferribacteraceae bacterium]|jgi:predicted RNase H-like HicB family nuclease|nr:type II toxin-antitoxin system HicB family antitoxin [Deferribacteraceae bacterium]